MSDYNPTTPRSIPEVRAELDKVAAAIQTVLHRDGTAPNQMEADLDMNGNSILNAVTDPNDPSSLVTKAYVDAGDAALDAAKVNRSGDVMTGNLSVPTPTQGDHAANADYVNAQIAGLEGAEGIVPLTVPRQQGDGVTVVFNSPATNQVPNNSLLVNIDGVTQRPFTDYTADAAGNVVFTSAPPLLSDIDVTLYEPANLQEAADFSQVTATGSTTPRTLADRFADVFNVKDFGAVGDGITDDTASIKAACEAAFNAEGGTVIIPTGRYVLTSTLDLSLYSRRYQYTDGTPERFVGINIIGQGSEATHLLWKGGQNLDGNYGTCIIARTESFTDDVSTSTYTGFRGTVEDLHITVPDKTEGHSGGWAITNRFTTIASPLAGTDYPNLATYPTNIDKDNTNDSLAACGVYIIGLSGSALKNVHVSYFAYGVWAGVGYSTKYDSLTGKWNMCGFVFADAITTTLIENSTFERNAVGMLFRTSSLITVANNVIQANYAGADVVIHSWNNTATFKENYFEVSPKSVVIRTDSGGDFRNSKLHFIRNYGLGLDVDTGAIDDLYLTDNQIRHDEVTERPDVFFNDVFSIAKQEVSIYVKDNQYNVSPGTPTEELFALVTDWQGNDTKRIFVRDTVIARESLTTDKYYGRVSETVTGSKTAVSVDYLEVRIPEPPAGTGVSGLVEVTVTKSKQEDSNLNDTVLLGTYEIMYDRFAGTTTQFAVTTPVEKLISRGGPGSPRPFDVKAGVVKSGSITGDNTLTISEYGDNGGASTAQVLIEAKHKPMTGVAFIRNLV